MRALLRAWPAVASSVMLSRSPIRSLGLAGARRPGHKPHLLPYYHRHQSQSQRIRILVRFHPQHCTSCCHRRPEMTSEGRASMSLVYNHQPTRTCPPMDSQWQQGWSTLCREPRHHRCRHHHCLRQHRRQHRHPPPKGGHWPTTSLPPHHHQRQSQWHRKATTMSKHPRWLHPAV